MARPCIEWTDLADVEPALHLRLLHITKVPPSDSGVARHAYAFDRALDALGVRTTIGLPIQARESQRMGVIVRLLRELGRRLARESIDVVVVDLAGRSLAEFYAACLVAVWPNVSLWVVVHDAPALVGPSLLVSSLDRKGGRRIGLTASRVMGTRIERWLLRRAGKIIAFSEPGASALREQFAVSNVWAVPLPVELIDSNAPKQPIVYCPAGVSAALLQPTMYAFESRLMPETVRLRVGNLSAEDRVSVISWARDLGIGGRVELLDFQDQRGLDESFATAAVVVRHTPQQAHVANQFAASSPVMSAMAAGCALLSTDSRGSQACVASSAIDLSHNPELLPEKIIELARDFTSQHELGVTAVEHVGRYHTPDAVSKYLLRMATASPGLSESRALSAPALTPD